MGIQNLLPFVKKACRQGNIAEFRAQSIAVDISCFLHRALVGCASEVTLGYQTDFYIRYVTRFIKMLTDYGCHVILVFDGQPLPAKRNTNDSRREKRDHHRNKGKQLLSEGKVNEAYDCLKKSASLTRDIIDNTIEAFQNFEMVDILVAPYESDAQLAYLNKIGLANVLITEDSDLIAFGCEKIIFKLKFDGTCIIYERKNLSKCFGKTMAQDFSFDKFRRICILSGCDYLQAGLPGIGINKATTFFSKVSGSDLILPRIPRYLNMNRLKIKKEFIKDFIKAENTFLYQIVFDPIERKQRPLTDYPFVLSCDLLKILHSLVFDIFSFSRLALGNELSADPSDDKFILPENIPEWSIWRRRCRKRILENNSDAAKEYLNEKAKVNIYYYY
ncbi:unnamed protein product [Dracunculus medinensis]|uniref:Exonuclease 1 n=1 Tax=Dracunculus medinensis TaxID=318479 RepID=A0A0N4UQP0_DRAME|nr:unnamed protein product [Dracunculus medinensis]